MRHPSQVIELALKTLFNNHISQRYMCTHILKLRDRCVFNDEEAYTAVDCINIAIKHEVTLASYLRGTGEMPKSVTATSEDYIPYAQEFYRKLIAQLRADDPMFLIIESAYHCAFTNEQIHQMVAEAGLPETSDETIANLLGNYAETLPLE